MAATAGNLAALCSRALRAGEGSVIGGRVLLAIDPHALSRLGAGRDIAVVSGTNGKTTTTRLLATAAAAGGRQILTNSTGANLASGLAATLSGDPRSAEAVLEVDEGLVPAAVEALRPRLAVLLNLSRDQLDRAGEVRMHAARWRSALGRSPATEVVANVDDPLVSWAAEGAGNTVTWVGTGQRWRLDATTCPSCSGRIEWRRALEAPSTDLARHDGDVWACQGCGRKRPVPGWVLLDGALRGPDAAVLPLDLRLPGWANRANAAMAVAAASRLGVAPRAALAAIASVADVAGRYAEVPVNGAVARLLLAKNPAGWAEVLDVIGPPPRPVVIGINARIADGRDPSWLWDVPFERLAGRDVTATGERVLDLAVRLRYAGVDHTVVPGARGAIARAAGMARTAQGTEGEFDVAANYTAFCDLRKALR